jgi:hypothetical protein
MSFFLFQPPKVKNPRKAAVFVASVETPRAEAPSRSGFKPPTRLPSYGDVQTSPIRPNSEKSAVGAASL